MRRFAKSLKADMSSEGSNPSLSAVVTRSTMVVRQTVNLLVEGSNPSESVPLLCKGSTGDFDSSSLGSNPSEGTGVYTSGQRGQTVNLLPLATGVRIPPLPFSLFAPIV